MKKITKPILTQALIAGFFSSVTIGILTLLTYKTTLGLFLTASFGSSMVLLFGYPESPFAQPRNVFFGHLITALVGVLFVNFIPLPIYINISLAVGMGIFLMIIFDVTRQMGGGAISKLPFASVLGCAELENSAPAEEPKKAH